MRVAGIFAISAAAHAAVLLALPGPEVRIVPTVTPPAVTVEPAPAANDITAIETVELPAPESTVDSRQSTGQTQSAAASPAHHGGGARAMSASSAASGSELSTVDSGLSTSPDDTGPLAMRGAQPQHHGLDMSIGGDVIAKIMSEPPPAEVPDSGRLETDKDGTITIPDLTFTAHVNPDGTIASIDDKPNFHFKVHIPHPKRILKAVGNHLAAWAADPEGVANGTGHDATQLPSGNDKTDGRVFTIIDGGFDVTDAIMRAVGQDPYDARKRAALEATFDERVQIGEAYRAQQYATSDQLMLKNVADVWARTDLDAAGKREALFELWDECVETGPDDQVKAAGKARDALYRWIDTHLPKGDPEAFSDGELAGFNARKKSHDTFAPYR